MFVLPLIPPPEVLFPMLLATFDTDLFFVAGCAEVRPLKPEPRTRFRVLPLTADTSLSCAAGISFSSVSASGSSDVDPYSMIVLLEALGGQLVGRGGGQARGARCVQDMDVHLVRAHRGYLRLRPGVPLCRRLEVVVPGDRAEELAGVWLPEFHLVVRVGGIRQDRRRHELQ